MNSQDRQKVLARLLKILGLADPKSGATEAECEEAMRQFSRMVEEHQISDEELKKLRDGEGTKADRDKNFKRCQLWTGYRLEEWTHNLIHAVLILTNTRWMVMETAHDLLNRRKKVCRIYIVGDEMACQAAIMLLEWFETCREYRMKVGKEKRFQRDAQIFGGASAGDKITWANSFRVAFGMTLHKRALDHQTAEQAKAAGTGLVLYREQLDKVVKEEAEERGYKMVKHARGARLNPDGFDKGVKEGNKQALVRPGFIPD